MGSHRYDFQARLSALRGKDEGKNLQSDILGDPELGDSPTGDFKLDCDVSQDGTTSSTLDHVAVAPGEVDIDCDAEESGHGGL